MTDFPSLSCTSSSKIPTPSYILEALKMYPFWVEPPQISHYREYPWGMNQVIIVCTVTWPLNRSETSGDLVSLLTFLFLRWVPEIFSRMWRGASSAFGRRHERRSPKKKSVVPRVKTERFIRKQGHLFSHGALFKTWPKLETAHEKSLAPRVFCF